MSEAIRHVIGVDPGVSGAIVFVQCEGATRVLSLECFDVPTTTQSVGGKRRKRLDIAALDGLLNGLRGAEAWVEEVHSMPRDGPVGAFAFGFTTGAMHAALTSNGCRIHTVTPTVWKAALGVSKDKASSILRARQVLPRWADTFVRNKDGRAEAALIAVYGVAIGAT